MTASGRERTRRDDLPGGFAMTARLTRPGRSLFVNAAASAVVPVFVNSFAQAGLVPQPASAGSTAVLRHGSALARYTLGLLAPLVPVGTFPAVDRAALVFDVRIDVVNDSEHGCDLRVWIDTTQTSKMVKILPVVTKVLDEAIRNARRAKLAVAVEDFTQTERTVR